mmetsp:Transcript_19732/g.28169  ORF Transcript_19732/g.28169 Transcript_19732/m.28169 type:complete len:142 (-) Transcript_19732:4150-4575(-)
MSEYSLYLTNAIVPSQSSPINTKQDMNDSSVFSPTDETRSAETLDLQVPNTAIDNDNLSYSSDIIKNSILDKILFVLNNGSFDELIQLQQVGKKRALMILTIRNSGYSFRCIYDLDQIGMSKNIVDKFIVSNLPYYCGIFH